MELGNRVLTTNTLPELESLILRDFNDVAAWLLPGVEAAEFAPVEERAWDADIASALSQIQSHSLDIQIDALAQLLTPSQERLQVLQEVTKEIENILRATFPSCKLVSYGSTVTGFGFRNSDLDIYAEGISYENSGHVKDHTKHAALILRREERFRSSQPITNARIPIVKLLDRRTGVSCDINLACGMGVRNSRCLKFMSSLDERCVKLVLVIKYFCMKYGIIGSGPGKHLNSYTVNLMTIFFLQMKDILPSIKKLQENVEADIYNNWNFAFNKDYVHCQSNKQDVSILFKEFFKFYKKFPFTTHVICPLIGKPIKRYSLKFGFELPEVLSLSPKFGKKNEKLECNSSLVIQDPFELTRNVAAVVNDDFVNSMIETFDRAYRTLKRGKSLGNILDPSKVDQQEESSIFEDVVEILSESETKGENANSFDQLEVFTIVEKSHLNDDNVNFVI